MSNFQHVQNKNSEMPTSTAAAKLKNLEVLWQTSTMHILYENLLILSSQEQIKKNNHESTWNNYHWSLSKDLGQNDHSGIFHLLREKYGMEKHCHYNRKTEVFHKSHLVSAYILYRFLLESLPRYCQIQAEHQNSVCTPMFLVCLLLYSNFSGPRPRLWGNPGSLIFPLPSYNFLKIWHFFLLQQSFLSFSSALQR